MEENPNSKEARKVKRKNGGGRRGLIKKIGGALLVVAAVATSIGLSLHFGTQQNSDSNADSDKPGIYEEYENVYYPSSSDKNLTHIEIPEGYTSIGLGTFNYYSNLQSITIPESVTSISEYAFHGCDSLQEFNVSPNNQYYKTTSDKRCLIDNNNELVAFAPYGLDNYDIPNGVISIGDHAFDCCSNLQSITIPDSVTSIGDYAFRGCDSLTSLTIPNSVTSIGDYAFIGCDSLTSVTIPNSVTSIGDEAFSGCDSLTSIIIPDSVTSIGDEVFYGCDSLQEFNVSPNNQYYKTTSDKRCLIDNNELVAFASAGLESYEIPEGVTSIGDNAFYGCSNLQSITIPDSVTTIGKEAFSMCYKLQSITIPDSVTSIGDEALGDCDNLNTVNIPKHLTEEDGWEKRVFGTNIPANINVYDSAEVKEGEDLSTQM